MCVREMEEEGLWRERERKKASEKQQKQEKEPESWKPGRRENNISL